MSEHMVPIETSAQLTEERRRQPFILSRCPEWALTVDEDMLTSAEALADGPDPHAEEKRVTASLYSLQYLKEGMIDSYKNLIGIDHSYNEAGEVVTSFTGQKPEGRLLPEQFLRLHAGLLDAMPDGESFDAMAYIMLLHDIGKNPKVMRAVGLDPETGNHDEALRRLFRDEFSAQRALLLPTFTSDRIFTDRQKELIKGVLTLPVNWPGLMQSQYTGAELNKIPADADPQVVKMSFWHGVLDIAGVAGHINPNVSLTLTEATANNMLDASTAFLGTHTELGIPEDVPLTGELRNDLFLILRARRYGVDLYKMRLEAQDIQANITAADKQRAYYFEHLNDPDLSVKQVNKDIPIPSNEYRNMRAKVIFANMARISSPAEFMPLAQEYDALPIPAQLHLGLLLETSGINTKSYELDYGPALLKALRSNNEHASDALRFMEHILSTAASASVLSGKEFYSPEERPTEFVVALRNLAIEASKEGFNPSQTPHVAKLYEGTLTLTRDSSTVHPNSTSVETWPLRPIEGQ